MTVSRKWTQAIAYAEQAARLAIAGAYEDAHRILAAYRAYQAQWQENSIEWWLCTEAFEDEWNCVLNKLPCPDVGYCEYDEPHYRKVHSYGVS